MIPFWIVWVLFPQDKYWFSLLLTFVCNNWNFQCQYWFCWNLKFIVLRVFLLSKNWTSVSFLFQVRVSVVLVSAESVAFDRLGCDGDRTDRMAACCALLSLLQRDVMDTAVTQHLLVCRKYSFSYGSFFKRQQALRVWLRRHWETRCRQQHDESIFTPPLGFFPSNLSALVSGPCCSFPFRIFPCQSVINMWLVPWRAGKGPDPEDVKNAMGRACVFHVRQLFVFCSLLSVLYGE